MRREACTAIGRIIWWTTVVGTMFLAALIIAASSRGYQLMSVQSDSMLPYVSSGGAVVVDRRDMSIDVGDVITYRSPWDTRSINTHRVVAIDKSRGLVTTKGDNTPSLDTVVPFKNVLGTVHYSVPLIGYGVDALKRPLALLTLVYVPACVLIITEVRRLGRYYSAPPRRYVLYR